MLDDSDAELDSHLKGNSVKELKEIEVEVEKTQDKWSIQKLVYVSKGTSPKYKGYIILNWNNHEIQSIRHNSSPKKHEENYEPDKFS